MKVEPKAAPFVPLPKPVLEALRALLTRPITQRVLDKLIPALSLVLALGAIALGLLSIVQIDLDPYAAPVLIGLCIALQLLFVDVYRKYKKWAVKIILLSGLAFVCLVVLSGLPQFVTGLQINGVLDRSLFAGTFLLAIAIPTLCASLYYLLGATPQADDLAHYPLVLLPVIVAVGLYVLLIQRLVNLGTLNFSLDILTQPYLARSVLVKTTIGGGDWPTWTSKLVNQAGMLNHVLGTGLLMLLTSLISLPVGAGAGLFLGEFGEGRWAGVARFLVYSLRATSLLIIGFTAYSLAQSSTGGPLATLFHGTYFNGFEEQVVTRGGSYLTASLALSLLVIPMIARATEEGCRSLPPDLREASLALGASEETTLRRVVVPWALPNIVTALLLGCAEAAGSVAVIMFVADQGIDGVGVFRQVTSLAYLIFGVGFGDPIFIGTMRPYQFMAGILLLAIILSLGLAAILIKRWLVWRYRGG